MTVLAPAMTQAVDCEDLSYQFATHLAVDRVNLAIAPGEMYGLLGPNGAGKTTTIRMITTLLTPATGSVRVFGIDAAARPMLVRRVIGYVPQALSADANLTGTENVELFARLFDVPRRSRKQRVADALDAMGLTERPSFATRPRLSSPSSVSLLTIVLTLFGASRNSAAASATPMPGRRAASRSNSERAGGSGSPTAAVRTARRATRRTAPMAASNWAASDFARSSGELTSFTELTIWASPAACQEGQEGRERQDGEEGQHDPDVTLWV